MGKFTDMAGARAQIDFQCAADDCNGIVKFNLVDIANGDFQAVCPKCLNDEIEFKQLNENYTGRAFYLLKCKHCGTEFILLEDKIDCCRRGIINCKRRIDYENKKIKTYEEMLENA